MKKITILFCILIIPLQSIANVKGMLKQIEDKRVLYLWGNHYERGYAHGYLVGSEIKSLLNDYILEHVCSGSAVIYNLMRVFFQNNYLFEEKYMTEAEGIIRGMSDAGHELYNPILKRELDAIDVLACATLPDLSQALSGLVKTNFACASISSWGNSTADDSDLKGNLVISRLMDWENHPTLAANHILIVHLPSEENEQKWISFAFGGFIACLSGINENGIGAFMNVGNHTNYSTDSSFYPVLLSIRNGIELSDYNQDQQSNGEDVYRSIQDRNRSGASLIHIVQDKGYQSSPMIVECNNERGVAKRDVTDNTIILGDNLVVTNHFRSLYDPVDCIRYQGIADSLNRDPCLSQERSWSVLKNSAGWYINLHAIQFIPSTSKIKWATSSVNHAAFRNSFSTFDIDSLFAFDTTAVTHIDKQSKMPDEYKLAQNYPNPFNAKTIINYELPITNYVELSIYNILGQKIVTLESRRQNAGSHTTVWDAHNFPSGVYFYRLETKDTFISKKLLLVK